MFPAYWIAFLSRHGLEGASADVPAERDLSGLGITLAFLTAAQSLDEARDCWPGIGVAPDGYVPVGACLGGSGDWYYIDENDGEAGPLYRIYHDAVDEDGYDPDDAIAVVLGKYAQLLDYIVSGTP